MQETKIVNVKKEKCDIYIGRFIKNAKYDFKQSPFGSPCQLPSPKGLGLKP